MKVKIIVDSIGILWDYPRAIAEGIEGGFKIAIDPWVILPLRTEIQEKAPLVNLQETLDNK